jgi:LPS-assembly lipoprotein
MIATLLLISMVSACGWQLRGATTLPNDLTSLYVSAEDAHGALITEIKQQLKANKVMAATSASAAPYTLAILEEESDRRTAGVGSDALTSAYEITLKAEYEIRSQNGAVLAPATTATTTRTYNYSASNASSAVQEEAILLREMRRDIARQMLRRLQALPTQSPTQKNQESANGQAAP